MTVPRTPEHRTPLATMPASAGDFAQGTLLGDWKVEQKIGEGGMGVVYAAVHSVIGKRAALKVIRSELCADAAGGERFVQEARLVNEIGHPNIVDIFHIGRLGDGRPYLVMELLRGRTLGDQLAAGRVPACEAIEILLQICAALGAAHGHGIVHRDLKPDNVFMVDTRSGPVVKLVDWGIAKLRDPSAGNTPKTRTGALVGTPQYISPEQARGRDVDERTDLYSLGAIAYELFLEEPPFTADNVADLIAMHLREPVAPPSEVWPDIPPALEALLVAMLAKDPTQRPGLVRIIEILDYVHAELEARSDTRRITRRLPDGTIPPDLSSLAQTMPSTGAYERRRVVTAPGGVPVSFAAASGPFVRVLGSGPVDAQVGADSVAPEPAPAPEPVPAPRRGRRLFAAAIAIAAVAVLATVLALDRKEPAPPAAESTPPRTVPAASLPAPVPAQVPAPAPEVVPSQLEIVVTPRSARVLVDGEAVEVDDGRAVRTVSAGEHHVQIVAPGHLEVQRTLDVGAGTLRLEIKLEEAPRRHHRSRAERRKSDSAPPKKSADPDGTIDPFE